MKVGSGNRHPVAVECDRQGIRPLDPVKELPLFPLHGKMKVFDLVAALSLQPVVHSQDQHVQQNTHVANVGEAQDLRATMKQQTGRAQGDGSRFS